MKKRTKIYVWTCLLVAALLWSATVAWAQVSADYDLTWHLLGSGGPAVSSADYRVEWTVGQPIVDVVEDDAHVANAGFWAGIVSTVTPRTTPTATPTVTPTIIPESTATVTPTATPIVTPAVTLTVTPETTDLFIPNVSN